VSEELIIFPAIDLRGGRVVRLRQGDPAAETAYADDPTAVARRWAEAGAAWLHVVNLDGALQTDAAEINLRCLAAIRRAVDLPIQFGGGLRTLDEIELALEAGATRVVLGTAAVRQPALVAAAIDRCGAARIVVGIDARDGRVAVQGWQEVAEVDAHDLARRMAEMGVVRIVYTDIRRDGMLSGVNVQVTTELAAAASVKVIASGGVRDLDDVRALKAHVGQGVEGVIIGQALYRGAIDLAAALAVARE
jgi:phosphoribosylformimino-5-aminoimidazole carboxamide ribotide isomerase